MALWGAAALLAVAGREVRMRGRLLLLGGLLGLLPVLAPWVVDLPRSPGSAGRAPLALILLLVITVVLAPLLGVSVLSADVASRRLGFFLARPLGVPALVAGKVLGGLLVLLGVQLLVAGPSLALEWRLVAAGPRDAGMRTLVVASFLLGSLFIFALGLAGGMLARLRSRLVLADAAALLSWALLAALGVHRWGYWLTMPVRGAWRDSLAAVQGGQAIWLRLLWLLAGGVAALALVWLVAPALALARGRGDGPGVHRWLSLLGWPAILVLTGLLVVLPDAVARRSIIDPPGMVLGAGGGWVAFGSDGEAPALVEVASGRFRAPAFRVRQSYRIGPVVIAAQAPRAAWLGWAADWAGQPPRQAQPPCELFLMDLSGAAAVARVPVRSLPLSPAARCQGLQLSADGTRAVVLDEGAGDQLLALDLQAGKVIHHGPVPGSPGSFLVNARFVSPTVVQIYRSSGPGGRGADQARQVEISTFDFQRPGRPAAALVTVSAPGVRWWRHGAGVDRLLTVAPNAVNVHDGRSGAVLVSYPLGPEDRHDFVLLPDGGLAAVRYRQGGLSALLGRGGVWGDAVPLSRTDSLAELFIASLPTSPGQVYVTWRTRPAAHPREPARRALVDLGQGRVLPLADDVAPVAGQYRWRLPPLDAEAQKLVGRLAVDGQGRQLFLYDPSTGQRRPLVGGGPAL